jgi:hypothetical protein
VCCSRKLKYVVIGRCAKPGCFKNMPNNKAWVTVKMVLDLQQFDAVVH